MDVAGFNYNGTWGGKTPGNTPAVNDIASNGTFNAADQTQIGIMWASLAQQYIDFNVNVTTVDPATGANALTDTARQAFYDSTPNFMHTVVGSGLRSGTPWQGPSADGLSFVGVVTGDTSTSGNHTNWMFTEAQAGAGNGNVINGGYIGEVSAHENAHAFGLSHQSDYNVNTNALVNEYAMGDANPGNGTYVPTIGQADGRQRVTWRLGDSDVNGTQTNVNDIQKMLATDTAANATADGRAGGVDLHFINDGVGHTRQTATPLALNGSTVNFNADKGVIVPTSEATPNPIGTNNYTQDWFSFASAGTPITLTANDGSEFLSPGTADPNATLRSLLSIFDSSGQLVANGNATEAASTLLETYSGTLAAGSYYAEIQSFGGHVQDAPAFTAASYYDTGAFFLTGSGFVAVPEPASIGLFAIGVLGLIGRRRRTV